MGSFKRITGGARFDIELHRLLESCRFGVNSELDSELVEGCRLTPFKGPVHGLSEARLVTSAKGTKLVLVDKYGNEEKFTLTGCGTPERPFQSTRARNVLAQVLRDEPDERTRYRKDHPEAGTFHRWVRANNRRERAVKTPDALPFTEQGQGIPLEKEESRPPARKGFTRW